jgi:hypothetical protein
MAKEPREPKRNFAAEYSTVELAGDSRLILKLGDGRMFGVALPKSMSREEPLPERAELIIDHLDEAGVPQGATFSKFVI